MSHPKIKKSFMEESAFWDFVDELELNEWRKRWEKTLWAWEGVERRQEGLRCSVFSEGVKARLWICVVGLVGDEPRLRGWGQAQEGKQNKRSMF